MRFGVRNARYAIALTCLLGSVALLAGGAAVTRASASAGACSWHDLTPSGLTGAWVWHLEAVSPRDAWAAGDTKDDRGLALHWNGKSWRQVKLQPGVQGFGPLDANSPKDAWGLSMVGEELAPNLFHWNGLRWSLVQVPKSVADVWPREIFTPTPRSVWLLGAEDVQGEGMAVRGVIAHWDGQKWSRAVLPKSVGQIFSFNAIDGSSDRDIWVVGERETVLGEKSAPLALHWNGADWRSYSLPSTRWPITSLGHVAVAAGGKVWAIGETGGAEDHPYRVAYNVHLKKGEWRLDKSPGGAKALPFRGVAAAPGGGAWLYEQTHGSAPRIFRWGGRSWLKGPTLPLSKRPMIFGPVLEPFGHDSLWVAALFSIGSKSAWKIFKYGC